MGSTTSHPFVGLALAAVLAAAYYAHRPAPSARSARMPAEEAMRAVRGGMQRQNWREGISLLPERRPQLFSASGSALTTLPCLAWNASVLSARGTDVWLSAWQALPHVSWGAAEFVLARGREAEFERSQAVTLVPDISLADVVMQASRRPPTPRPWRTRWPGARADHC